MTDVEIAALIPILVSGDGCILAGKAMPHDEAGGGWVRAFQKVEIQDVTVTVVVMGPATFQHFVAEPRAYELAEIEDDGPEDGIKGSLWGARLVQAAEAGETAIVAGLRSDGRVVRQVVRGTDSVTPAR